MVGGADAPSVRRRDDSDPPAGTPAPLLFRGLSPVPAALAAEGEGEGGGGGHSAAQVLMLSAP